MASIKQLVGTNKAEQLYAFKDQLKDAQVLRQDPMRLNRTQFEKYLSAKAEQLIAEHTANGVDVDTAFRKAEIYMVLTDSEWREEAKRLNESAAATIINEVRKAVHA